jgi:hypothetical protein
MAARNSRQSWLICILTLGIGCAHAEQTTTLAELLQAHRYGLTVQDGDMSGPGATVLEKDLAEAQFVAIGEEHGTREVPQFVWASCRAMAKTGLDAMAIEAGPLVTSLLQRWSSRQDGYASLLSFEQRYPDSIAFFSWQQEFDLLSRCQQASAPHRLQLWGLDQEFLGSSNYILQQILAAHPGPAVETIVRKLQAQCSIDERKAVSSGRWADSCMLQLSKDDLTSLQVAVAHTTNRRAQDLSAALIKTQRIYSAHESGQSYQANRERARLLKRNFVADYQHLLRATGKAPRVLLKFGANHLFKGFDETDLADLGNFVSEFSDGLESASLHIEVLGIQGYDETISGPGQPDQAVKKDAEPGPLAPLYAEAFPQAWTLFDLRPLRSKFSSLGHLDRELERLIFGYDLLIVIPEVSAQSAIH